MIVKIQRPIATNLETPEVLVYNEDRSVYASIPMAAEDIDTLFGLDLKQYWETEVYDVGSGNQLVLKERVEDQVW